MFSVVRSYASSASIQAGVVTQVIGAVVDVQVNFLQSCASPFGVLLSTTCEFFPVSPTGEIKILVDTDFVLIILIHANNFVRMLGSNLY